MFTDMIAINVCINDSFNAARIHQEMAENELRQQMEMTERNIAINNIISDLEFEKEFAETEARINAIRAEIGLEPFTRK